MFSILVILDDLALGVRYIFMLDLFRFFLLEVFLGKVVAFADEWFNLFRIELIFDGKFFIEFIFLLLNCNWRVSIWIFIDIKDIIDEIDVFELILYYLLFGLHFLSLLLLDWHLFMEIYLGFAFVIGNLALNDEIIEKDVFFTLLQ